MKILVRRQRPCRNSPGQKQICNAAAPFERRAGTLKPARPVLIPFQEPEDSIQDWFNVTGPFSLSTTRWALALQVEHTVTKKLVVLTTIALVTFGTAAPQAQARDGRNAVIAAGVIGGLAVGALLGAGASSASAAPAYGYAPANEGYASAPAYETRRVVRRYDGPDTYVDEYAPRRVYRTTRVVRTYDPPAAYEDDCPPERT